MALYYVGESGGGVGDGVRKLFKGVSFRVEADICVLTLPSREADRTPARAAASHLQPEPAPSTQSTYRSRPKSFTATFKLNICWVKTTARERRALYYSRVIKKYNI